MTFRVLLAFLRSPVSRPSVLGERPDRAIDSVE
jgi:hypothetical protein